MSNMIEIMDVSKQYRIGTIIAHSKRLSEAMRGLEDQNATLNAKRSVRIDVFLRRTA